MSKNKKHPFIIRIESSSFEVLEVLYFFIKNLEKSRFLKYKIKINKK